MKRFFLLLFFGALFLFAGCGGNSDESLPLPKESDLITTEIEGISLSRPPSWDYFDVKTSPEKLSNGAIFLMRSPEPWGKDDTEAVVAGAKENLSEGVSSRRYAEAAFQKLQKEIINFELIREEDMEIQGEQAKLIEFTGKNSFEGNTFHWLHFFTAKGNIGYVISGAMPTDTSEEEQAFLKKIVTSFSFVNPES